MGEAAVRGGGTRGVGAGTARGPYRTQAPPPLGPGRRRRCRPRCPPHPLPGRSRPASVRARPRAGHSSPPPRSPGSGAALSGIRKQCILRSFGTGGARTRGAGRGVRRRPKVRSGASAAEQTEWACKEQVRSEVRGSSLRPGGPTPSAPSQRPESPAPSKAGGQRDADRLCRRPRTRSCGVARPPRASPAPRGPPRAHLDATLRSCAGRHVRGAASLPA